MDFRDWLDKTKTEKPELAEFIEKTETFFTDAGFNGSELEKRITAGLRKIDAEFSNLTNLS